MNSLVFVGQLETGAYVGASSYDQKKVSTGKGITFASATLISENLVARSTGAPSGNEQKKISNCTAAN